MHDLRKEFGQLQSDYNRAINNFGVILSRLQLSKDGTKVIAPRSEDFVPVLEGFFTVLGEIATKTGRLLEEALSHKEIIDSNYHSKAVASPKSDSWNCLSYEPKHISHEIDIMVGRLKMAAKTNINLLKVPRNKHEKTLCPSDARAAPSRLGN